MPMQPPQSAPPRGSGPRQGGKAGSGLLFWIVWFAVMARVVVRVARTQGLQAAWIAALLLLDQEPSAEAPAKVALRSGGVSLLADPTATRRAGAEHEGQFRALLRTGGASELVGADTTGTSG
jgi:hypothetical protein